MKIAVVVDATCDLPHSFVEHFGIEVLPTQISVGDDVFLDRRDPEETKFIYLSYLAEKGTRAEVQALGIPETSDFFLTHLVTRFDRVLVLTISAERAQVYEHATKASFTIVKDQRQMRTKAGLPGSFAVRVVDTKTMLAGQAIMAHEAVHLINDEELTFERLRPNMEKLSQSIECFFVPKHLNFLYRGRRGQHHMSVLGYAAGKTFDVKPVIRMDRGATRIVKKAVGYRSALDHVFSSARDAIGMGLLKPIVAMSYAGEPREMLERDDYQEFADFTQSNGIELLLSVMSASAAAIAGPGAFSLAYAV